MEKEIEMEFGSFFAKKIEKWIFFCQLDFI
jgi:hypothetical protein